MARGYNSENTSIHMLNFHFVWCPKYRRKILIGQVKQRLETLIIDKATKLKSNIISLEIMPDHIHLFIQSKPTNSPNHLIAQIKGYTSRILRQEYPHLKSSMPSLWTRSYFVSTAGNVSQFVIQKYIKEQNTR
jgi:putative transposase